MKNIFKFGVNWNYKSIILLVFLVIVPNILGMLNISTQWGFNIHFFQVAIFLAALIYGPWGGALSGAIGSAYTASIMNNPYIIIGNILLGFFVGFFARKKMHTLYAVGLAFAIQIPWLVLSNHFLIGMPMMKIWMVLVALTISNLIWGSVAHYTNKPIKQMIK